MALDQDDLNHRSARLLFRDQVRRFTSFDTVHRGSRLHPDRARIEDGTKYRRPDPVDRQGADSRKGALRQSTPPPCFRLARGRAGFQHPEQVAFQEQEQMAEALQFRGTVWEAAARSGEFDFVMARCRHVLVPCLAIGRGLARYHGALREGGGEGHREVSRLNAFFGS